MFITDEERNLTALSACNCATSVWACCIIRSSLVVFPIHEYIFALYPQVRTRARFTYFGRRSGCFNQQISLDVQVLIAPPLSPCTATILWENGLSGLGLGWGYRRTSVGEEHTQHRASHGLVGGVLGSRRFPAAAGVLLSC